MKKEMNTVAMPGKDEKDWEAENAAEDIMRAERHKSNPELMKRAHKHLKKRKKEVVTSLAQLREIAKAKMSPDEQDDDEDME